MKTKNAFPKLTNEELINQLNKTKNDLLFGLLYDRYSNIVYNKCYGFAKTTAEAQDLA